MMLSRRFARHEFRCKDGTDVPDVLVPALTHHCVTILDVIRDALGVPVTIVSGLRTKAYNRRINGAKASLHLYIEHNPNPGPTGKFGTDLRAKGKTPTEVAAVIERLIRDGKIPKGGVGIYPSWVHYDNRGYNKRWSSTAQKDSAP